MSNLIFPTLPGLKWDQVKTPIFSTRNQLVTSGKSVRTAFYQYPLYQYDLSYEILRDYTVNSVNELQTLMGFYLSRQGGFDSFLYKDPSDNLIASQGIGIGDGNTKSFQLIRTYGGYTEPVNDIIQQVAGVPVLNIYLDGVKQNSGYTVTYFASGLLTFTSAPGNGVVISADFSYYRRVCFDEFGASKGSSNSDGFSEFMYNLWECKRVSLIMVR